jgi:Tfp pilus assembly protein PilO
MSRSIFQQSNWMFTLPLAALAVAYLAFVWLPGYRTTCTLWDKAKMQREYVAQAAEWPAKLREARQEFDRTSAIVASWEKASPHKKDLSLFYGKIYALAKDAGLTITRFDPQTTIVFDKFNEIPIAIHCTGRFVQVFEFLRGLEGLPGAIWVENMRIEKTNASEKDVQCELSLVIFSDNSYSSDYTRHTNYPINGGDRVVYLHGMLYRESIR